MILNTLMLSEFRIWPKTTWMTFCHQTIEMSEARNNLLEKPFRGRPALDQLHWSVGFLGTALPCKNITVSQHNSLCLNQYLLLSIKSEGWQTHLHPQLDRCVHTGKWADTGGKSKRVDLKAKVLDGLAGICFRFIYFFPEGASCET